MFSLLLPIFALATTTSARVNCRYNATAPGQVDYSSCSQLAHRYGISIDLFFRLNPLLDPDCSSLQGGKEYCVAGSVLDTTTDGTCGPSSPSSCLGYSGGQCCNSQTLKCGKTEQDCAPGVCIHGLCSVPNPEVYSLDGSCGPANGKECGGRWGDCCDKTGRCGTGSSFCSQAKCWSGNCTIDFPAQDSWPALPIWQTGNSTDGTCGAGAGKNQICNVSWGFCCASTGKCGTGDQFCGTGCQPAYGNCTDNTPTPPPPGPGDVSPDGMCGTAKGGFVCAGSVYGDCCSAGGFCGNSTDHCKPGSCQPQFGTCAAGDPISVDGSCGSGAQGRTCKGSGFGDCCSSGGWCGSTDAHCKAGCQSAFGTCTGSNVSIDGSCGSGAQGRTCKGSGFGDCCSSGGWCGGTDAHCKAGCQSAFGTCTGSNVSGDGTCGPDKGGLICKGSGFGDCCSSAGYCGSTAAHCGTGCRPNFGSCTTTPSNLSKDGSCGPNKGSLTCTGAGFGPCCSAAGFCGSTASHCGNGCRPNFGTCTTGSNVSGDGSCGPDKGSLTCTGSGFGTCCSSAGFCGSTSSHCGAGCRPNFGICK